MDMTIKEAAEIAKCCTMSIRRAVHAGKLPAYKTGKGYLFYKTDLNAWIKSRLVMPRAVDGCRLPVYGKIK